MPAGCQMGMEVGDEKVFALWTVMASEETAVVAVMDLHPDQISSTVGWPLSPYLLGLEEAAELPMPADSSLAVQEHVQGLQKQDKGFGILADVGVDEPAAETAESWLD